MKLTQRIILPIFLLLSLVQFAFSRQDGPSLFLTARDIQAMREATGKYALFDKAMAEAKSRVEQALSRRIDVPVPIDAGGATHERHKQNYIEMHLAGVLYAVTKDRRYAEFVREMLLRYATLYPTLGRHPAAAGEASGRLFWQTLNETVWLVYTTQAYDCIRGWLNKNDRAKIEDNVFRPMARFLSSEHAQEMDRIHNHGTWTCAAVGMVGYLVNDRDLIDKALYSSRKDGSGGFIRQIEMLFSPDGFYTEGPYYARYALLPFFTFAQVIENNQPGLKIFEFRDRILQKALHSALQLTSTDGGFIPINDALKEMTYLAPEIVAALDITFQRYGGEESLLAIAAKQNTVMLNGAGVEVAKGLAEHPSPPGFPYVSVEYTDGPNGTEGGVGLLRPGRDDKHSLVLMKYGGHGLSHGHYDKLSIVYYDNGREILQDYGAARFVNVEQKYGGRYLPENKSYAMQTIAHNTVVVDEQSQFKGSIAISEKHHADRHFFTSSDPAFQVMSAKLSDAYPGVRMQRAIAMVRDTQFAHPILVDVVKIDADREHIYDLPFYYQGQLITTNAETEAFSSRQTTLGTRSGYQHLWKEAEGKPDGSLQVTWMTGGRFYTLTSASDSATSVSFVRIGATDPKFNLRHDPGIIIRKKGASLLFVSVLEPHGSWDGVKEFSANVRPFVAGVRIVAAGDEGTALEIDAKNNSKWTLMISNGPPSNSTHHRLISAGQTYEWTGNAKLLRGVN